MPYIIAWNVGAHLLELHTLTTERTAVLPREGRVHAPTGLDVQPLELLEFIGRQHCFRGFEPSQGAWQ